MLESAREVGDGGRHEFNTAEASYFLRCDESDLQIIIDELTVLGRLSDGRVTAWGNRQYESDTSRERQKSYRDRKKTKRDVTTTSPISDSDGNVTSLSEKIHESDGVVTPQETDTDTENTHKGMCILSAHAQGFDDFWKAYPEAGRVSRTKTETEWQALDNPERQTAMASLPAFKAWISKQPDDYTTLHAWRYLEQKRFIDHKPVSGASGVAAKVPVYLDSPQWKAWTKFKGRSSPVQDIRGEGREPVRQGWHFPSEWPPGHEPHAPIAQIQSPDGVGPKIVTPVASGLPEATGGANLAVSANTEISGRERTAA
jgi:hypothetical protein